MLSKAKTLTIVGTLVLHAAALHAQTYNKRMLGQYGWMSPAIATFQGRVYYAYLGLDNRMRLMSSPDGQNFSTPVVLPDGSLTPPALATFGNRLYIAWSGANFELLLRTTSDGATFSDTIALHNYSYQTPSLVGKDSRLFIAWAGTDKRLNVASSMDGFTFSQLPPFNWTSKATPALSTSSDGKLFLAWADPNGHIYTAYSYNGISFTAAKALNETAYPGLGPSLQYARDYSRPFTPLYRLFISWTGTDCQLNTRYSPDGSGADFPVYTKSMLNDWTFYGQALAQAVNSAGSPDGAYIAWTGTDYQLNIARLQ